MKANIKFLAIVTFSTVLNLVLNSALATASAGIEINAQELAYEQKETAIAVLNLAAAKTTDPKIQDLSLRLVDYLERTEVRIEMIDRYGRCRGNTYAYTAFKERQGADTIFLCQLGLDLAKTNPAGGVQIFIHESIHLLLKVKEECAIRAADKLIMHFSGLGNRVSMGYDSTCP